MVARDGDGGETGADDAKEDPQQHAVEALLLGTAQPTVPIKNRQQHTDGAEQQIGAAARLPSLGDVSGDGAWLVAMGSASLRVGFQPGPAVASRDGSKLSCEVAWWQPWARSTLGGDPPGAVWLMISSNAAGHVCGLLGYPGDGRRTRCHDSLRL